jgi:serine protease AprX
VRELNRKPVRAPQRLNWKGLVGGLLLVALLVPMIFVVPGSDVVPRAQPALLEMAAERPDDVLGVIVQKGRGDSSAEELVARLGGVVTRDLWIINAFAAEIPAAAVPELAKASGVAWVSLDAPMVDASCPECVETSNLMSHYVQAIGADELWNEFPYLQGQAVTVAVVDSGLNFHDDLDVTDDRKSPSRILVAPAGPGDGYGHGTHVGGIIAGNGLKSGGLYIGVAPKANLANVRVSNAMGASSTSDVVAGLQWIYDHQDEYGIRVVNLALNSSVPEAYHTSPLDAAVEILWFSGIVVVVPAGNHGDGLDNGVLYPPANDPFVITVGATDDQGTGTTGDDVMAFFSAYGVTESGFAKPDLVAPGTDIVSLLAKHNVVVCKFHPDHRVDDYYFRMSGTSMASAVTAGAVALLLQDEPTLTPDQVKYRLMATARHFDTPERAGAGYLDIYAAVHRTTTQSANTGIPASQLLWTGDDPVVWDSVNWNSVNWNSVNWNSVNWSSVNWSSVNWSSVHWDK